MKRNFSLGILFTVVSLQCIGQIETDTVNVGVLGLESLIVEKIPVTATAIAADTGLSEEHVCYRLFLNMTPDFRFISCSGLDYTNPQVDLLIESTKPFYNNSLGSDKGQGANPAFYPVFPSIQFDTYVADGRIGTNHVGVLRSVGSDGYIPITPETTPAGEVVIPVSMPIFLDNQSLQIKDPNSGWGVPGGSIGPDPEANIVFIGQLTTAGVLKMKLNITLQNPYGDTRLFRDVAYGFNSIPEITFIYPLAGSYLKFTSQIGIEVMAQDFDGVIDSVQFYVNDTFISTDDFADIQSYKATWTDVTLGEHTVKAIAFDNEGNFAEKFINFTVAEYIAPEIQILEPSENDTINLGESVMIMVNATDTDGIIDSVSILINDQLVTDGTTFQWTPSELGTYQIKAIAVDNDSLSASAVISVVVVAPVLIENESAKPHISVFPNPVRTYLTIYLSQHYIGKVNHLYMYDVTGNMVNQLQFKGITQEIQHDVTSLNNGIYFLRISDGEGIDSILKVFKY